MKNKDQILLEEAYLQIWESTPDENLELSEIKNWRAKLRQMPDKDFQEVTDKVDYAKTTSQKAFSKLYRFHVLEYKLHLLQTKFVSEPGAERLIDFTKHELLESFNWLKEWMLAILETRIYMSTGDEKIDKYNFDLTHKEIEKHEIKQIARTPGTKSEKGIPWTSIIDSYKRLNSASNLKEKIIAVTLSLNAWHDHGGIFGISSKVADEDGDVATWHFAPLTIEQYDRLDNIDTIPIEKEIKKDLY